jgi:hypothetical protein
MPLKRPDPDTLVVPKRENESVDGRELNYPCHSL